MAGELEPVDVLQFMSLRQAAIVERGTLLRDFVVDTVGPTDRSESLLSALPERNGSDIANVVVSEVFCTNDTNDKRVVEKILNGLTEIDINCAEGARDDLGLATLVLLEYSHRLPNGKFVVLPDRLETALPKADASLVSRLHAVLLEASSPTAEPTSSASEAPDELDIDELVSTLEEVLQGTLEKFVFDADGLSNVFRQRLRVLFDALYKLYIIRRRVAVDLREIMTALATLHAIEWLALDRFLDRIASSVASGGSLDPADQTRLDTLEEWLPELRPYGLLPEKPPRLVDNRDALRRLLQATPVVHPIFAQLWRYRKPFNPLRPVGIGDLKVVKQWLVEYVPGEISHVANVLKGETNVRKTRKLEKTEDVFSFTGQTSQETSTDTQTTDHLELKREVENTVKTDLQLKVDQSVSAQWTYVKIGASVGFGFSRTAEEATKAAEQFARDVVGKAVSKLQTQSTQTRSLTKTFESEEAVEHTVENNKNGAAHVNGFYRFVDKRYMAQLYNFGKRLMFEFIVPEPAAFLIESRLRAFEGSAEVPTKPEAPELTKLDLRRTPAGIRKPADITRAVWERLRTTYDLSALPPYPPNEQMVHVVDSKTQSTLLARRFGELSRTDTESQWMADSFEAAVEAEGVEVSSVSVVAALQFWKWEAPTSRPSGEAGEYRYVLLVNGYRVEAKTLGSSDPAFKRVDAEFQVPQEARRIRGGKVTFAIEAFNLASYSLSVRLVLKPSAESLLDWQTAIYNAVRAKEQELVDAENREMLLRYQSDLGDYYRALRELRGTAVNDVLQGESTAANRRIIDRELRRHCLAELTMEFDEDWSNDRLSNIETIAAHDVTISFQKMKVDADGNPGTATFEWKPETHRAHYPETKLSEARRKGTMVQFLEQAFDWDNLSYLFYPYFWATRPKWVDLMSRADDADATYTSFLQAGSARVLVSVTPGYEHAVAHYLATGEPWAGGAAPVIGDPLFVAVYQELRDEQDNLADATPEGEPWEFVLPTSLTYLDGGDPLPVFPQATPVS